MHIIRGQQKEQYTENGAKNIGVLGTRTLEMVKGQVKRSEEGPENQHVRYRHSKEKIQQPGYNHIQGWEEKNKKKRKQAKMRERRAATGNSPALAAIHQRGFKAEHHCSGQLHNHKGFLSWP